jgi:hypothetical protein
VFRHLNSSEQIDYLLVGELMEGEENLLGGMGCIYFRDGEGWEADGMLNSAPKTAF